VVADKDAPEQVPAGELDYTNIGTLIRFRLWDANHEVATVITAELRQIYHNGASTTLTYGIGAERESSLEPEQLVTLRPPPDYSDVEALASHDGYRDGLD
jgi:hypothetical protein